MLAVLTVWGHFPVLVMSDITAPVLFATILTNALNSFICVRTTMRHVPIPLALTRARVTLVLSVTAFSALIFQVANKIPPCVMGLARVLMIILPLGIIVNVRLGLREAIAK